jgi:hypothetical protein
VIGAAIDAEPPVPVSITWAAAGTTITDNFLINDYSLNGPGDDILGFDVEANKAGLIV